MHPKSDWKCCDQYDGTTETIINTIQGKGKKYGKLVCAYCKHFIRHIPNPKTLQQIEDRKAIVDKLLSSVTDEKHLEFLENIKEERYLTPKQHFFLLNILGQYSIQTPKL